jgi:hypothetical protein
MLNSRLLQPTRCDARTFEGIVAGISHQLAFAG